jgi:hypothetical protein
VLDSIEEDFNFLYVGHWLQGEIGQDRKDTGMLIKTFLETFKGKGKKPGLILKTSSGSYSVMDKDTILEKINKIRQNNKNLIITIGGSKNDNNNREIILYGPDRCIKDVIIQIKSIMGEENVIY